jgi:putative SOS response-associated peptidase YedK
MCGRIVLTSSEMAIATQFQATATQTAAVRVPSYNVGPTSEVYAIAQRHHIRQLDRMVWGLIPAWATDRSGCN